MKELSLEQMQTMQGGSLRYVCGAVAVGSVVYAAGIVTNFWNPIGWISSNLLLADAVCAYMIPVILQDEW